MLDRKGLVFWVSIRKGLGVRGIKGGLPFGHFCLIRCIHIGQVIQCHRRAGCILLIILGFQTVSAIAMFLFPELIVRIYTDDAVVGSLAVSLLFYAAVFQYPDGIQMVMAGALRGYKDTRMPMLYTMVAFWIVGMTLGYTLTFNRGMGPAGMWIGMIAGLTVAAALMLRRFHHTSNRFIAEAHT